MYLLNYLLFAFTPLRLESPSFLCRGQFTCIFYFSDRLQFTHPVAVSLSPNIEVSDRISNSSRTPCYKWAILLYSSNHLFSHHSTWLKNGFNFNHCFQFAYPQAWQVTQTAAAIHQFTLFTQATLSSNAPISTNQTSCIFRTHSIPEF
jgi:hypothetical protein